MSRRSQKREQKRLANKKITFGEIGERANKLRINDGKSYQEIMDKPKLVDHYNAEAIAQLKLERAEHFLRGEDQRVSNVEKSAAAHAFKSNSKPLDAFFTPKAGPPVGKDTSTYRTGKSLYGDAYGKPVKGTSKAERRRKKR